jgi:hypothetical protein
MPGRMWGRALLAITVMLLVILWLAAVWFLLFAPPPEALFPLPSQSDQSQ